MKANFYIQLDLVLGKYTQVKYVCEHCFTHMDTSYMVTIKHPTHTRSFFGKQKPIRCPLVGKHFKFPQIELEERIN